jgi:L-iditol 2-dehydrogenase
MWAMQLVAPRTFAEVETPAPGERDLGPGEVLLEVLAGGICGSDLPTFRGIATPGPPTGLQGEPLTGAPLHEVVGRVVASRDPNHVVGSRVVGWASHFDGLAEVVVSRGDDLALAATALPPEREVMLQPLACVLYAVQQLPKVAGARAAVLGLGPIGLLFAHVLRTSGAASVIGVDAVDRGALAKAFGLDEAVHATTQRWLTGLRPADRLDVVVEAIGHNSATVNHALSACALGGCAFAFGVPDEPIYPIDVDVMLRNNLTLKSGVTLERPRMLAEAADYLDLHPSLADVYVTHVHPAPQAQDAFDAAVRPAPAQIKVTLGYR